MTDLPVDEAVFRSLLDEHVSRLAVAGSGDVDGAWSSHVRTVHRLRRRRQVRVVALAAVLLLVGTTAGRSTVSLGGAALAGFGRDLFQATVDKTVDVIVDEVDSALGSRAGSSTDSAHGPIDESNDFWVEVHWAHGRLNDAVGWNKWNPRALDDVAERLRVAAELDPTLGDDALAAADLVDEATRDRDRDAAVRAHRQLEAIERELATRPTPSTTVR